LHGLLNGEGEGSLLSFDSTAIWWVLECDADSVVNLNGKVKVPKARVVLWGDRKKVTDRLLELCPGRAIVGAFVTAGDGGMATAGDGGTATAGDGGTATAGDGGTATAGFRGTATAGYGGTATAGYGGTATAGNYGTATAGNRGTATAGDGGTATAGEYGTLILKYYDGIRYRTVVGYVGENGLQAGTKYKLNDRGEFEPCKG